MKKNLTARTVIIVVTILICVFGIIGIPKSGADLVRNFSDNIRLGLDLKGGTHLVLEIQVQDAVKADADQTAERLKEDLKKQNITWNSMDTPDVSKVEDAENVAITIKGIPATQSSAFRSLVGERYPTYLLTALNSTDYTMKLKPTDLQDLKVDTVKRAVDTIGNRIDQLGLAEKSVQQYGEAGTKYEVLVQLPGVDDPARAKELIGTAAVLEIVDVKEGPFPSREAALAQKGGILPLGTKLARTKPRGTQDGEQWYLVGKNAGDYRAAKCAMRVQARTSFASGKPTSACRRMADAVSAVTPKPTSATSSAWCWTTRLVSVATIQSKIEDSGRITGLGSEEEAVDLSRYLRTGSLPAGVLYIAGTFDRSFAGRRFDSPGAYGRYRRIAGGNRRHAGLLQALRRECGAGADFEHDYSAGRGLLFPRGADSAGYRRNHPDDRYGGGFQRTDFRTYPRGTAQREERDRGRGHGLRQGLVDHRRYPRDHGCILRFPVPVRRRAGSGICGNIDNRFDR